MTALQAIELTIIVVDCDVLMSAVVRIIIEITNDDRQCTGATVPRYSAITHHYRHVELFLFLTIKLPQTPHYPGSVSIGTAHCQCNAQAPSASKVEKWVREATSRV